MSGLCPNCLSEDCEGFDRDGVVYGCNRIAFELSRTLNMNGMNWCEYAHDYAKRLFGKHGGIRVHGLTTGPFAKKLPDMNFRDLDSLKKWSDAQIAMEVELFEGYIHAS